MGSVHSASPVVFTRVHCTPPRAASPSFPVPKLISQVYKVSKQKARVPYLLRGLIQRSRRVYRFRTRPTSKITRSRACRGCEAFLGNQAIGCKIISKGRRQESNTTPSSFSKRIILISSHRQMIYHSSGSLYRSFLTNREARRNKSIALARANQVARKL